MYFGEKVHGRTLAVLPEWIGISQSILVNIIVVSHFDECAVNHCYCFWRDVLVQLYIVFGLKVVVANV